MNEWSGSEFQTTGSSLDEEAQPSKRSCSGSFVVGEWPAVDVP